MTKQTTIIKQACSELGIDKAFAIIHAFQDNIGA